MSAQREAQRGCRGRGIAAAKVQIGTTHLTYEPVVARAVIGQGHVVADQKARQVRVALATGAGHAGASKYKNEIICGQSVLVTYLTEFVAAQALAL